MSKCRVHIIALLSSVGSISVSCCTFHVFIFFAIFINQLVVSTSSWYGGWNIIYLFVKPLQLLSV
jgi:hypothetical protein